MYLARHGETTWNVAGRYQGRLESALSALGVRQGIALAEYFVQRLERDEAVPVRVLSSPLLRCTATAQFTATRLDLAVETDERLIEIGHGSWEGRYREELERNDPGRYKTWRQDPARVSFEGGETLAEVAARWNAFAASLLARADEDVLVVTHDAVVRVALLALEGRPLDDFWQMPVENAAFARIERVEGRLRLVEACRTEHLADLRASVAGQAL